MRGNTLKKDPMLDKLYLQHEHLAFSVIPGRCEVLLLDINYRWVDSNCS